MLHSVTVTHGRIIWREKKKRKINKENLRFILFPPSSNYSCCMLLTILHNTKRYEMRTDHVRMMFYLLMLQKIYCWTKRFHFHDENISLSISHTYFLIEPQQHTININRIWLALYLTVITMVLALHCFWIDCLKCLHS